MLVGFSYYVHKRSLQRRLQDAQPHATTGQGLNLLVNKPTSPSNLSSEANSVQYSLPAVAAMHHQYPDSPCIDDLRHLSSAVRSLLMTKSDLEEPENSGPATLVLYANPMNDNCQSSRCSSTGSAPGWSSGTSEPLGGSLDGFVEGSLSREQSMVSPTHRNASRSSHRNVLNQLQSPQESRLHQTTSHRRSDIDFLRDLPSNLDEKRQVVSEEIDRLRRKHEHEDHAQGETRHQLGYHWSDVNLWLWSQCRPTSSHAMLALQGGLAACSLWTVMHTFGIVHMAVEQSWFPCILHCDGLTACVFCSGLSCVAKIWIHWAFLSLKAWELRAVQAILLDELI